jgi:hypothetical protein
MSQEIDKERVEEALRVVVEEAMKVSKNNYWKVRRIIHCVQLLNDDIGDLLEQE